MPLTISLLSLVSDAHGGTVAPEANYDHNKVYYYVVYSLCDYTCTCTGGKAIEAEEFIISQSF